MPGPPRRPGDPDAPATPELGRAPERTVVELGRAPERTVVEFGRAPADPLPGPLRTAVAGLAARPQILVAVDFDGVLAPIVDCPQDARPLPEASAALSRLAGSPGVQVALVSGRTLADLRRLAGPPPSALLVGSHGAQFATGETPAGAGPERDDPEEAVPGLDEAARALLARVTAALERISEGSPGTFVEHKPAGAVLHTRRAARAVARSATEEALAGPSSWPGVHLTRGKEVVDLSVVDATKGGALDMLRARAGLAPRGGGVIYLGDDVTDERAFAVLDDDRGDVTVKVGEGSTIARHRVADPRAVAHLLARLADLRDG
ncbi:MAG TPA: trehalose-phosphatase [Kineosporiaceae bacterium]|nr:trehalose-phosphatase [Kineosporiaceae bacterium]